MSIIDNFSLEAAKNSRPGIHLKNYINRTYDKHYEDEEKNLIDDVVGSEADYVNGNLSKDALYDVYHGHISRICNLVELRVRTDSAISVLKEEIEHAAVRHDHLISEYDRTFAFTSYMAAFGGLVTGDAWITNFVIPHGYFSYIAIFFLFLLFICFKYRRIYKSNDRHLTRYRMVCLHSICCLLIFKEACEVRSLENTSPVAPDIHKGKHSRKL